MRTIQNQTFDNQVVDVDDTAILDCVFTDCILRYSGHFFTIDRSQWLRCPYVFFGPAEETFRFSNWLALWTGNRNNGLRLQTAFSKEQT